MTVAFKTFGCRLNRAESLDLEARFIAAGHQVVELTTDAAPELIIVRGCSVTARAQRDCEREIVRLQARHPAAAIRITGCLPGGRRSGDDDLADLLAAPASAAFPLPTRTSRAYLKVQDGCSGRCAFCIVPQFRGSPVSVPFAEVLARAQALLDAGYRELVVTGCNLALYRAQGHGLPELLAALAELSPQGDSPLGIPQGDSPLGVRHRVRLGSLEPGICDQALLEVFAAHSNICRFLHLSVQSGSDAVLHRMNRPYRIGAVARFCADAAARLGPRLALGADLIAGFPGETSEDHLLTQRFLTATPQLVNLHVFPYSERPGTPAATMSGALPRATRLARARELEQLGRGQRAAFAAALTGKSVTVCVERGNDHGWTDEYLSCHLQQPAERRALVDVVVDHVVGDQLFAVPRV